MPDNLPTDAPRGDVTALLRRFGQGEKAVAGQLLDLVYPELHRIAGRVLRRERAGHTLQPTALLNEAYLRLVHQHDVNWNGRTQFFSLSASLMRRVLIDYARQQIAEKRGGPGQIRVDFDERLGADAGVRFEQWLAVHEALERLEQLDPRQARIVELRYFGGLSVDEAAEESGLSTATVKREWNAAKAWLRRELGRAANAAGA